jgi:hypothetical protein
MKRVCKSNKGMAGKKLITKWFNPRASVYRR